MDVETYECECISPFNGWFWQFDKMTKGSEVFPKIIILTCQGIKWLKVRKYHTLTYLRVVHVWLQNSVHSLLYLVVKMVDEIEKVNLLLSLHLLLNLLLDLLLNVQNLLLNAIENV